jgi:alpha-glucosidase
LYNYDGRGANNLEGHNVFALNMVRSSYEGMKQVTGVRPFILSRSGYAGLQRYSAIWTGDNQPTDDHMLLGVRMLNSMGLSGLAFTGMDISGFLGDATPALFTRWMQIGAFMPYCRNHKITGAKPAEPWCYGENALNNSRSYIELRYHLLPYLYSIFYEATQDGLPINRSLAIDYSYQENIYKEDFQNQYLFGENIMVAPFKSTDTSGKIYLPKGDNWYDLYTDKEFEGGQVTDAKLTLDRLPLYIKAGSVIPMQSLVQSTAEMPTDTLVVQVYNGNKSSSFTYYEDDGESYKYQKGDFYKRVIKFNPADKTIEFSKVDGTFASKFKYVKILFHGSKDTQLKLHQQYFSAIPYMVSSESEAGTIAVKSIVTANVEKAFSVKY